MYPFKVIFAASLLIVGVLLAQTKIEQTQAKFGAPVIPIFVDAEVPLGIVNGTNNIFNLASNPNPPSSLHVYWNGLRQNPAAGGDYTIVNNVLTMAVASTPQPGDNFFVDYRH